MGIRANRRGRPIRVDVRVIAATNRDLKAAVARGAFREDLYYRFHVFPLEMPPLRARGADIPLLVEYFIDRYGRKAGKNFRSVEKKNLQLLQSYPWPGNIRDLQNVIERSIILCEAEIFAVDENWLYQRPLDTRSGNMPFLSKKVEGLKLRKEKQSKRLCENRKNGYSDHPAPRPSWGSRGPPWNRRFGAALAERGALGPMACAFQPDVTQERDWRSASAKRRHVGEVDIVVKNAGYLANRPAGGLVGAV